MNSSVLHCLQATASHRHLGVVNRNLLSRRQSIDSIYSTVSTTRRPSNGDCSQPGSCQRRLLSQWCQAGSLRGQTTWFKVRLCYLLANSGHIIKPLCGSSIKWGYCSFHRVVIRFIWVNVYKLLKMTSGIIYIYIVYIYIYMYIYIYKPKNVDYYF